MTTCQPCIWLWGGEVDRGLTAAVGRGDAARPHGLSRSPISSAATTAATSVALKSQVAAPAAAWAATPAATVANPAEAVARRSALAPATPQSVAVSALM
ncbi:hypothetical protein I4F81_003969 [Pyropia yezoensis]|uniref:Uncharacterized protein n=1 Tax=Pyropia yezoensis TaxID=2788 RepID=A0ACC3BU25_PYRYE|nr:hypothetical protein I4F81_003969 [Neopyropia yezoensis]